MASCGASSRLPPARIQIAPMLGVTDRHFRQFIRGITKHAELWTEMQVESTLRHTDDLVSYLDFDANEHPIVCQLGGCDPENMTRAAELVAHWGYDEVNVNVGCPSSKVAGRGCFGAALMKSPEIVRDVVHAIKRRCPNLRVSVKTRVGVDEWDSQKFLSEFISVVSAAGCDRYIIHARKAWLNGLNPTKNRTIPPLQYERVFELAKRFPNLSISLNGGVSSLEEVDELLYARWRPIPIPKTHQARECTETVAEKTPEPSPCRQKSVSVNSSENPRPDQFEWDHDNLPMSWVDDIADGVPNRRKRYSQQRVITQRTLAPIPRPDIKASIDDVYRILSDIESRAKTDGPIFEGVMIGRAALNTPCVLASVDSQFYGASDPVTARTPRTILKNYISHLDRMFPDPAPEMSCFSLMRPTLGILARRPGSKPYRSIMDETIRVESRDLCPGDVIRSVVKSIDEKFPGTLDDRTTANI